MNFNDLPMVDSSTGLTFTVQPRDIKGAICRNPEECPVARAAKRVLNGNIEGVKIGANVAYVRMEDRIIRFIVSVETAAMVKAYDQLDHYPAGVPVKLLAPSPTQQLGAKARGGITKKPKGGQPNIITSPKRPWLRHIGQPVAS